MNTFPLGKAIRRLCLLVIQLGLLLLFSHFHSNTASSTSLLSQRMQVSNELAAESTITETVSVDFRVFVRDRELQKALIEALHTRPANLLLGSQFAVTSENDQGNWQLVSIASLNGPESSLEHVGNDNSVGLILAAKDRFSGWHAALAGTELFSDLLIRVPEQLITPQAKLSLDPLRATSSTPTAVEYKFPWAEGDWGYWQTWHGSPGALDIGTARADKRVLASAGGTITFICRGTVSANIHIRDGDGLTIQYFHIDINQIGSGITVGAVVPRGKILGVLRSGTWSYDGCGYTEQQTYNAHLHWVIPTDRTFTSDGWTITHPSNSWYQGSATRVPPQTLHSTNRPDDGACSTPSLNSPGDGYIQTSTNHSITFSWSPPSNCVPVGYTFRVKTVPNMDSGGEVVYDEAQSVTQVNKVFEPRWDHIDLYWSIRACNPCTPFNPGPWATPQRFRLEPGGQPIGDTITLFTEHAYGGTSYGWHDTARFGLPDYMDEQASSILIKDGWSARVFEMREVDPRGGTKCYDSNDNDFSNDEFDNGIRVDNNVSAIEVYQQDNCPSPPLPGDANDDNKVDGIDYVIWLNHYNQTTTNGHKDGDFNSDGKVDGIDYVIWLNSYGSNHSVSSTNVSANLSASSIPNAPSDASFSYEINSSGSAGVVSLSWKDNAPDEDGFMIAWSLDGYGATTISTLSNPPMPPDNEVRSDTTLAAIAVIPCDVISRTRGVRASISAFNAAGASSPTSSQISVFVPACPTKVHLPLVASEVHQPPQPPVNCMDHFDTPVLEPEWQWINPLGDSSYSLMDNPGYLRLYTPDGEHDLYQNFNAPRLMRSMSGDFIATTKVAINPQHNYQGAGLLLWQDENNYVRLERTLVDGIDVWYRVNGTYDGIQIPYSQSPVHLRLERSGTNVKALYSEDGSSWTTVTMITFSSENTLQVGLVLINQAQDNPISANFDFFELDHC